MRRRGLAAAFCALAFCAAAEDGGLAVNEVWFDKSADGYAIRARLSAGDESLMRQLLQSGYALRFNFDMRFIKSRDWFPDRDLGGISWTPEIVYDSLLERYTFRAGGVVEEFNQLSAALARAGNLRGAASEDPQLGRIFSEPDVYLSARYEMVISHLPQALQVSLLTGDWTINSGWRRFAPETRE